MQLSFNETKDVRKFIEETESGLYSGVNEDGDKVAVLVEQGVGLEVLTNQKNGWIRVNEYDEDGCLEIETFRGRWNKE